MAIKDNKIKKSDLKEAKDSYEEIKKFAKESAMKELEENLDIKVKKLLDENLTIDVDTESGEVTVEKDGQTVEIENSETHDLENIEAIENSEVPKKLEEPEELDEFIQITEDNMEEQEQVAPMANPPADPMAAITPPMEEPVDGPMEEPMEEPQGIEDKIAAIYDAVVKNQGGEEEVVDVIEDQPEAAPVAPEAPEAAPAEMPVQEEDIIFELEDDFSIENLELYPTKDEKIKKEEEFEIVNEISMDTINEKEEIEIIDSDDKSGDELEEVKMLGVSNTVQRTQGTSAGPESSKKRERLEEQVIKIKAQYESKVGELSQENKSLKEEYNKTKVTIGEYKKAFVGLRKQFDEMQTFNAKLAYLVKLYANGGFTNTEKEHLSEEFNKVETAEEAQKLYSKIIKEHKLTVGKNDVSKAIKTPAAKKATPISTSETLYESEEYARAQVLAGIKNNKN